MALQASSCIVLTLLLWNQCCLGWTLQEILNPDIFLVLNLQWAILVGVYANAAFLCPSLRWLVLRQMKVYSLSAWSFYRVQEYCWSSLSICPKGIDCASWHFSEMPLETQQTALCLLPYQELRSSFMRRVLSMFSYLLALTHIRTK